jgi:ABC-2 type transport system permease protein
MESARLPSDQVQFVTAIRRQFRFYRRTLRFYGLLGFVLLVSVAFLTVTIAQNNDGGTAPAYLASLLGAVPIFGIIICAFIGGDAISMDFGSGTGYFMLVLPVRRSVLLLGRYVAAFAASFSLLLVVYALALIGTGYFYGVGGVPWADLAQSLGLAALFVAAVVATAFFFSSFFRSPAMSMIATILILFLGFDIAGSIVTVAGVEPWFSILYAGDVITTVLVPAPHEMVTKVGRFTITSFSPYIWEGATIMAVYLVGFLIVSLAIYHRKESKG